MVCFFGMGLWQRVAMNSLKFTQAHLDQALQPFQGWPAHRAVGLRPSSTLLDTPRHTPMLQYVPFCTYSVSCHVVLVVIDVVVVVFIVVIFIAVMVVIVVIVVVRAKADAGDPNRRPPGRTAPHLSGPSS
jgi:Flp pilus assembly protein TadB